MGEIFSIALAAKNAERGSERDGSWYVVAAGRRVVGGGWVGWGGGTQTPSLVIPYLPVVCRKLCGLSA
jgi:hypothetical protein